MNKFKQLQVGQIFKNYKEICSFLDEEELTSNSKKAQIKEWECHFNFRKQGHKFIIEEVYEESLEKKYNYKGGGNSVYGDITQLLIVDLLMKAKHNHISISKSKLMETIGITNQNYSTCKEYSSKLSQYLNMDVRFIYDFYNINDSNFRKIIDRAINNLDDKRIIKYQKVYKVKPNNGEFTRQVTPSELYIINEIERNTLHELGFNKVSEIRKTKYWKTFQTEIQNKVKIELHIIYYYEAYDMTFNKECLSEEKDILMNKINHYSNSEEMKDELNDLVVNNVRNNTRNRVTNGQFNYKNYEIRLNDSYESNNDKLNNFLINRKTPCQIHNVINYISDEIVVLESSLPF